MIIEKTTTPRKRRKKPPLTFVTPAWIRDKLRAAQDETPQLPGELMWHGVVPAEWCLPTNLRNQKHWSKVQPLRTRIRGAIESQGARRKAPLPGKPLVVCVRLTSRKTDSHSGWDKLPVDMLRPRKVTMTKSGVKISGALGIIEDDSPDHIELRAWWQKSKLDVVYLRVYAGATAVLKENTP